MNHSDDVLSLFERIGGTSDTYQEIARARQKVSPKPLADSAPTEPLPRTTHSATPVASEAPPVASAPALEIPSATPTAEAPGSTSMRALFARLLAVEPAATETSLSPLEQLRTPPGKRDP